ncbi:CpsD/CapB family tyrosine-protein kinase [Rhodobacteraceae bacterium D3-12]|nr:CpsD/CapB family tyrosine-protein kinase [Rhodobacteraceae bacterium D3-12]
MSDERPTFTRKSRARLNPKDRARLISEFAALSNDPAPETFDLPYVDDVADDADLPDVMPADAPPAAPEGAKDVAPKVAPPEIAAEQAPAPEPEPEPAPEPEPEPEPAPELASPETIWSSLGAIPVDPKHLERNLIITAGRHDPAHGAFDVLRTRLVQTLFENDWKRVGITSPTRDCGKTFTAVNLAISLSRYETNRTVLMDMDMRNPSVANVIGANDPASMGDFLQGRDAPASFFRRLGRNALNIGSNLAVGLNNRVEPYASELLQDPLTDAALARMMDQLDPDVVLYDLPPALAFDDVIAFKRHFDGILMVIGGGTTKSAEIQESMRRLGDDVPLLGVVLNQAEGETRMGYSYGY